jgi:hypothetical protein
MKRLGQGAILTADRDDLRPRGFQAGVLSFSVFPSAEMAARALECFDDRGEHLRKGNVEIWDRFAASPAVLEAARRALA